MSGEILQLLERMADAAAARDYASAEVALRSARRGLGAEVAARLERVARGEVAIALDGGIAFVGEVSQASRLACAAALRYLRDSCVPSMPLLLVDCADAPIALTIPIVPGAAYVVLPSKGDHAASAAHELAHAHIRSANTFLDEGMAYYFELSALGRFPGDAALRVAEAAGRCPGCRTLLAYDAVDDPYFDKLLPGSTTLVHAQGALVFAALRERVGIATASELYAQVEANGEDAASALQAALDESLERLDARLQFRHWSPESMQIDARTIGKAYVRGDHALLERVHAFLMERGEPMTPPEREDFEAELIAMVTVAAQRAIEKRLSRIEYATIKGRIAWYAELHGRTARFFVFRGMLAFCRAPGEENYLDASIYLDDARVDLEMALARDPHDPQILSCLARWEWRLPEELGGNRERARDLLERIAAIPEHAEDVQASLERARAAVP